VISDCTWSEGTKGEKFRIQHLPSFRAYLGMDVYCKSIREVFPARMATD
jgi:hypothetical protein